MNKEEYWKKILDSIEHLTDRLGMPVDQEIKEAVAGLNANGINTISSCGGHVDKDNQAFPWISCQAPNMPRYRYIDEENLLKIIADKFKIKPDEIFYYGNEKAEKEYYLMTHDVPSTKEYLEWDIKNIYLQKKVKDVLSGFYLGGKHTKDVKIEYGVVYPGCNINVTEADEELWKKSLSRDELNKKIKESQKEMEYFGAFLKDIYMESEKIDRNKI
ncbi:MAG: hypothetical protein WCP15_01735 [bacterium]